MSIRYISLDRAPDERIRAYVYLTARMTVRAGVLGRKSNKLQLLKAQGLVIWYYREEGVSHIG